jgi:hypothetical protein
MPDKNKLVVIDTNCLVRIYFSPVRPLLSKPVALHELKTLEEMARELRRKLSSLYRGSKSAIRLFEITHHE